MRHNSKLRKLCKRIDKVLQAVLDVQTDATMSEGLAVIIFLFMQMHIKLMQPMNNLRKLQGKGLMEIKMIRSAMGLM